MPLVHAVDLLEHARDTGYRVAAFELAILDHIVPVIEAAERAAAPVILTFAADTGRSLVPALAAAVAVARTAAVPVVIEARTAADGEAVARAVRGGANSILLCRAADTAKEQVETAMKVAHASGVPLFVSCDASMSAGYRDYTRLPAAHEAACAEAERGLAECGGNGYAAQALAACRPWREVEHLIVYNVNDAMGEAEIEAMMARGRASLGAIPGVRQALTGRALKDDAKYRYCWLIRFAHPNVVVSYRDHPEHAAFADRLFRPVAAERISIDYEITE